MTSPRVVRAEAAVCGLEAGPETLELLAARGARVEHRETGAAIELHCD
jgi:hypothetical protein